MRSRGSKSDGHHVPHLDLAVRVVLISFQLVVIIFEIESCGLLGPARRHDATLGVKTLLLLKTGGFEDGFIIGRTSQL